MTVDEAAPKGGSHSRAGVTYYFCSDYCRKKFEAGHDEVPKGTGLYFCPMDPEIEQQGPGICPKCGMALQPKIVSADQKEDDGEYRDMLRRTWVGAALSAPLVVLAMVAAMDSGTSQWIQLVLASPVVIYSGWPFFVRAWNSFRTMNLNMFSLIGIGTAAAYAFSVFALLTQSGHLYFESAAVIITLVALGQVLELKARSKTSGAIKALLGLQPRLALRVGAQGDEEIAIGAVLVGDRLRVRPGEKIPVDGVVEQGNSFVNEAMLTGEADEVEKLSGAAVTGGSLNGSGSFVMRATRVGSETVLARIVKLVAEAGRSKAPMQKLADRVSAVFVPVVIAVAATGFVAWFFWGPEPRMGHALVAAVSVLIIACPCALGLATPMSVMVGLGRGAQMGILIKEAAALEMLGKVNSLIVDKTGTITEGKPRVVAMEVAGGFKRDEVLLLAAAVEKASEHPLARAVLAEAPAALPQANGFKALAGQGVSAMVDGRIVRVGKREYSGWQNPELEKLATGFEEDGATVLYVSLDDKAAGFLALKDPIKANAAQALKELNLLGIEVTMSTGDNARAAARVAKELGLEHFEAGVRPEDKLTLVQKLKGQGRLVAMAGDGVNDAPALAAADVGIAMGNGSDVALESAQAALLKGDLGGLARGIRLSRAVTRNIRQNLFWAFAYNALGIPLAAGALYPVFGWLLSPMIAALAMSLSSVTVIMNALRLRHTRI